MVFYYNKLNMDLSFLQAKFAQSKPRLPTATLYTRTPYINNDTPVKTDTAFLSFIDKVYGNIPVSYRSVMPPDQTGAQWCRYHIYRVEDSLRVHLDHTANFYAGLQSQLDEMASLKDDFLKLDKPDEKTLQYYHESLFILDTAIKHAVDSATDHKVIATREYEELKEQRKLAREAEEADVKALYLAYLRECANEESPKEVPENVPEESPEESPHEERLLTSTRTRKVNSRKAHNLKRRAKLQERKAERRAAILDEEPVIETIIQIIHQDNPGFIPDIPMIKGVLDGLEFHKLYEDLALIEEADQLPALQRAAASREWNKSQRRYVEIILPLATVMASAIRESA